MNRQASEQNPYVPPTAIPSDDKRSDDGAKVPKPIIPALIGIITNGASSPYALVLCIEQYLRPVYPRIPLVTHVAMALSVVGTIGWIVLSFVMGGEAFKFLVFSSSSMYGPMGLGFWFANLIWIIWTYWRIKRFPKND